jgi:outer membrane receptor for ferrienterochelin and colicins
MKLFLTLLFIMANFSCSWTQVSVLIVDDESEQPVKGASIKILNGKHASTFYFSSLMGEITLPPFHKELICQITAFGYETKVDTISPTRESPIRLVRNIQLDDIVVTAEYGETVASQAVHKINVISAEQIKLSGANNLVDILNYQTGIRLSQDNVLGTSISLEGISGENVKVLIDGVPVIGRLNGNVDLSQINLNNVERIEIVEGPLSVNYGTNALAGTINIITKKAPKEAIVANVNPYYESIGNYNLTGSIGLRKKKHAIQISGGRNYFDGWSAEDPFFQFPKSRLADTNRFKTWKPKEQYFGEFKYTTNIKKWQLAPYVRVFDETIINRGFPLAPYQESAFDDYYYTTRSDAGINIRKRWRKGQLTFIGAYNHFQRIKNTWYKDLTNLEQTLSGTDGAQDTSVFTLMNVRGNYSWQANDNWQLQTGLDLNYESAFGVRILNQEQFLGDYAAFFTANYTPVKKLTIKPGLRYAYNTVYDAPLIPSLNIKWNYKKWVIRGSVARGFRAPSLKELYFDFVDINHNIQGTTDLKPEYSWNYLAALTWLKPLSDNRLLKAEYSAFYNDIDNLITLGLIDDNLYSYINIGDYATLGNKLNFSYRTKNIQSTVRFNYVGRFNQLSDTDGSLEQYNWSPEIATTITWKLLKERLAINAFYKYNGALQSYFLNGDGEISLRNQSAFSILDMSISSNFFKRSLTATIGAKNILNVTNVAVVGQSAGVHSSQGNLNAARGVSLFCSLKYTFSYENENNE